MHPWLATALGNAAAATVLALLVAAATPLVRRPAIRHGLWLLVLLKLVTPPLGYLPIVPAPSPSTGTAVASRSATPATPEPAIPDDFVPIALGVADLAPSGTPETILDAPPFPAPPAPAPSRPDAATLALAAWLGGALLLWAIALLRLLRLMSALRRAEPAPADEVSRLAALAADLDLTRVPDLRVVDARVSPFVAAFGRWATVVVPAPLWARLDADQRDALLLHELAHLRRGDPWVRLVELAATGLYWWLPTLWLARRALHAAEEQACDAWVVAARPASARPYADALIETVEFLSRAPTLVRLAPVPVASSGLGRLSHVARRITMVMKDRVPPRLSRAGKLGLLGLGLASLPWLPGMAAPSVVATPLAGPAEPQAPATRDPEDEIDELEARVHVKNAELMKVDALAAAAGVRFSRLERQRNAGQVSDEEVREAELAVQVAEADRQIVRAELVLAQKRLERARQRQEARRRAEAPKVRTLPLTEPETLGAPATAARSAADLDRTANHLKQIGVALHKYLDSKGRFPGQAIVNAKGTPLLSWRVAILPYLDQQALYDRFHLDEPWDSPHNKELLKEMPAVFRSLEMPTPLNEPGLTRFQAIVGGDSDRTIIDTPEGATPGEITDGLSGTIMVVEAAAAVPWTKPDDLVPRGGEDEEVGHRTLAQGFVCLMGDGSVLRIDGGIPIETFHALVTVNGGELIDLEQVHAGSGAASSPAATGRLSIPGPGGSTVSIELPANVAAGSDEERAMKIAAEVARLIADRMHASEDQARRPDLEAQRARARIAELEAQLAATRDQIERARRAEDAARKQANVQRARAAERERQAVETVRRLQGNLESEAIAREKIQKEYAELIDRLLKLDDDEALLREAFQAVLGRRPTAEELDQGKEIVQRTFKKKPRREVIEILIRQITSYRDEPAKF